MRWVGKCLIGIVGFAIAIVLIGAAYQAIATAIDESRYPPSGQLVDIGGYRLHLHCTGEGSPTVVLDAMGFGWSTHWSMVQPEIAKLTRVCSYDRAGYGWSDEGPMPRTAQQVATELHTLLERAKVPGPYVLVGHSFSGYTVRVFRHAYPNEVLGIVLVDAGADGNDLRPVDPKAQEKFKRAMAMARVAANLGTVRVVANMDKLPYLPKRQMAEVPEEVRPLLRAGLARTSFMRTFAGEYESLPTTREQALA